MPSVQPHTLRTLATALDAGLGLSDLLETPKLSGALPPALVTTLRGAIRSNTPVGQALRRAELVDDSGAALLNAGVSGGFLPEALRATADLIDEGIRRRRRLLMAVAYPAFVLLAACVIVPLPSIVQGGVGAWARVAVPGVLAIVSTMLLVFVVLPRSPVATRQWVTQMMARLPIVGPVVVDEARATGLDVLQRLLSAGVSVTEALPQALRATGLGTISRHERSAVVVVERGGTLTDALAQAGLADSETLGRLAVAEHTGSLDRALQGLVPELHDRSRRRSLAQAAAFGVMVGVIGAVVVGWQIVRGFQGYMDTIDAVGRE